MKQPFNEVEKNFITCAILMILVGSCLAFAMNKTSVGMVCIVVGVAFFVIGIAMHIRAASENKDETDEKSRKKK